MHHLKTFNENYNRVIPGMFENIMHDQFLNWCNNVKEIVAQYNIKYQTVEDYPQLIFIFPYSGNAYGDRYVDDEYKMVESIIKELMRQGYRIAVDESETETKVLIRFNLQRE